MNTPPFSRPGRPRPTGPDWPRASLLALLLGSGWPALAAAADEAAAAPAQEAAKPVPPETRSKPGSLDTRIGELEKKMSDLLEAFEETNHEARSNSESLGTLKAQVEQTAIRVFEGRAKNLAFGEKLEKALQHLEEETKRLSDPGNEGDEAGKASAEIPKTPKLPVEARSGTGPLLAVALTFLAPLGFTLVEAAHLETWARARAGLRNLWVAALALLASAAVGSLLLHGKTSFGGLLAEPAAGGDAAWAAWLYRSELAAVAALTAACVLSDRLSLAAYGVLAVLLGLAVYPPFGHWAWDGGWLAGLGFHDGAGATVIYSLAAWFALAWAWCFPARRRFGPDEAATLPHPAQWLAGLGLLWLSGFGLALGRAGGGIPAVALFANLMLGGAGAVPVALAWAARTPETGALCARVGAGVLGGLVAVAAGVDRFAPLEAIVVGALAALLHGLAWPRLAAWPLRQDQVAANLIAAFGVCGAWGTLCVGLLGGNGVFAAPDFALLSAQATGAAAALGFGLALGGLSAWTWRILARPKAAPTAVQSEGAA